MNGCETVILVATCRRHDGDRLHVAALTNVAPVWPIPKVPRPPGAGILPQVESLG